MTDYYHWAGAAHLILRAAAMLGVAEGRLLEQAGVARDDLVPTPGRMAWAPIRALLLAAQEMTSEPAVALYAGRLSTVHDHGICGAYVTHLSPARASQRFAYEQIWARVTNVFRFHHEDVGDQVRNRGVASVPDDPCMEAMVHLTLTNHVAAYKGIFGEQVPIDHIGLRTTRLGDAARLSELAGCRVLTGQAGDWVCVPRELVERPIPLADPWLRDQLWPRMEAFLRLLDEQKDATLSVREALAAALASGVPVTLPAVAGKLGWKPRTLRARLAAEATSYTAVVDAERQRFALGLMGIPGAKLAAVAAQAGFSDPAAFTRAFRRWTGMRPSEWQRVHGLGTEAPLPSEGGPTA